jgi:hypothetical protein
MPYSLTYLAIALLAAFGVDNAEQVIEAVLVISAAVIGLYGRFRAGKISWWGARLN